jgi:hypothetical protein
MRATVTGSRETGNTSTKNSGNVELPVSLRDYFAGQVANECLAQGALAKASVMEIAEAAYEFADAMLAARKKET